MQRKYLAECLLSKSLLVSLYCRILYFVHHLCLLVIVFVLHSLYRAAVSALLNLVVLLIMLCEVAYCIIV